MTVTLRWDITITALSSIFHGGAKLGTRTQFRREPIIQPDGSVVHVPVISGNAFRGRLRRVGERLLREVLDYAGEIPLAAAHALRSGGSISKGSGEPLSGKRLMTLRALLPQLSIFGCARAGGTIDGCLLVGKVLPHVAETAHLLGLNTEGLPSAFGATQLETYTDHDETATHTTAAAFTSAYPSTEPPDPGQPMFYRIETLPAATRLSTWLQLDEATPLEAAFFTDLVDAFATDARLGGRLGIGHGMVRLDYTRRLLAGAEQPYCWRDHVREQRDQALEALTWI